MEKGASTGRGARSADRASGPQRPAVHGVTIPTAGDPTARDPASRNGPDDRRSVRLRTGCTSRPCRAPPPVAVPTVCTVGGWPRVQPGAARRPSAQPADDQPVSGTVSGIRWTADALKVAMTFLPSSSAMSAADARVIEATSGIPQSMLTRMSEPWDTVRETRPGSYTHLTLPTIYS